MLVETLITDRVGPPQTVVVQSNKYAAGHIRVVFPPAAGAGAAGWASDCRTLRCRVGFRLTEVALPVGHRLRMGLRLPESLHVPPWRRCMRRLSAAVCASLAPLNAPPQRRCMCRRGAAIRADLVPSTWSRFGSSGLPVPLVAC